MKPVMARILIVGTGSIGTVYAVILTRASADVVCVCRSNYDQAKETGLHVNSHIFGDQTIQPTIVPSVDEASRLSEDPFDYVIITTKSFPGTQQKTVQSLASVLENDVTTIVLLQNGLGVEQDYHDEYPATPIVSGVVYMPTSRMSPVSVRHTEVERLYLSRSPFGARHNRAEHLASIFQDGGATIQLCEDIQGERWKKIVANGAWNPLCALSRCHDQELLATSDLASDMVYDVMREICAVATACGYSGYANEETIKFQMSRSYARQYPGVEPSMMADMRNSREMEVEAILGGIIRYARQLDIKVPRLETMYILLLGLNKSLSN